MPKTIPSNIVYKFEKCIKTDIDHHKGLLLDVFSKKYRATLETTLAEQFVFNITVFWEVFLHDILLSYLTKSQRKFLRNFKDKINKLVEEKYGKTTRKMISFRVPRNLSIKKIALMIDYKNFNISIKSAKDLEEFANDYLVARYARLFSLDRNDVDFVNFVFAIRNYLAHRSGASRTRLNDIICNLSGINTDFNDSISSGVGFYLKQNVDSEIRSILIGKRMIDIANKFYQKKRGVGPLAAEMPVF